MTEQNEKLEITVEFSEGSLWGSADPGDYDQAKSERNYIAIIVNHLHERYPDVEIVVSKTGNDHVRVYGLANHDAEVEYIEHLIDIVFNGDDWLVTE